MELALTESLLYLPPLIIAGLIALYRNNILCFWDCNPIGIATKQFTGQVAVKLTWLLEKARSTALLIRNFPSALATLATKTQLMIVNTITGILVTIKENFHMIVMTLQKTLEAVLESFQKALEVILESFQKALEVILESFQKALEVVLESFQKAVEILWSGMLGILVTVQETLLAVSTFVVSTVANYTETLQQTAMSLFQSTKTIQYPPSYIYFLIVASALCLGLIMYGFYKAIQEPIQQKEMEEGAPIRKSLRLQSKKTS